MAVYFLSTDAVPLIKIGFTSNNAHERLMGCQVGSPVPLHMAAIYEPGDNLTDNELRWRLRDSRSHGDWFQATDELRGIIEAVQKTDRLPGAWHAPVPKYIPHKAAQFGMTKQAFAERHGLSRAAIQGAFKDNWGYNDFGINLHAMPKIVDHLRGLGLKITHRDLFNHTDATVWTDPPGHYEQLLQALGHITSGSGPLTLATQEKSAA